MEGGLRDDQADCRIGDESTYGGDGEMWRGEPSYDDRYSDEQPKGLLCREAYVALVPRRQPAREA